MRGVRESWVHAAECSRRMRQACTGRTRTRTGHTAQQALGRQVPAQAGGPSRATATKPAGNLQRDDAHEADVGGGERAAPQVHEHHHQRRAEDQARHHQRRALPARAGPQHLTRLGSQLWRGTTSVVPCPRALRLSTSPDQARGVARHHQRCALPARAAPQHLTGSGLQFACLPQPPRNNALHVASTAQGAQSSSAAVCAQ